MPCDHHHSFQLPTINPVLFSPHFFLPFTSFVNIFIIIFLNFVVLSHSFSHKISLSHSLFSPRCPWFGEFLSLFDIQILKWSKFTFLGKEADWPTDVSTPLGFWSTYLTISQACKLLETNVVCLWIILFIFLHIHISNNIQSIDYCAKYKITSNWGEQIISYTDYNFDTKKKESRWRHRSVVYCETEERNLECIYF